MADIVAQVKEWWAESNAIQQETWTGRALQNFEFYIGNQWTVDEREALDAAGRPARTINSIMGQVNTISGHQRQNRRQITILPRKGGNQAAADLFTALIKHTMDACNGNYEVSDWYTYGCIASMSWIEVDIDYAVDPINGNIVVRNRSPFSVLEDQLNLAYDVNEGRHLFLSRWQDRDNLALEFPQRRREVEAASSNPDDVTTQVGDVREDYDPRNPGRGDMRTSDRQVFVRECWYKTFEQVHKAVHLPSGQVMDLGSRQAGALLRTIRATGTSDVWRVVHRVIPRMHRVTMAGDVVLEQKDDPLGPVTLFPLVRFVPMWVDGYAMGAVDNLKDPQRVKNKMRSKVEEALSQTTNSGWKIKRANSPEAMLKLEQFGAKPGVIIETDEYGGTVEKILPNPFPAGLMEVAVQADRDIPEISLINSDLMGTKPNDSESGRARQVRQEAGIIGTEIISDNFARSFTTFGKLLLEIIRGTEVYSDEEIGAIVDEQALKDFIEVDPSTGNKTVHLDALNDWHLGEYGVTVSDNPNRPTVRQANFEQAMEMAKLGIPVPPDVLIDLSDMANKDEIKAAIAERQQ